MNDFALADSDVAVTHGAAAAVENEGALAAAAVLRAGGNAADAVVAGAFVQTVVDPFKSSIGGCGHILYHSAAEGRSIVIAASGVAPRAATATMYRPIARWENAFLVEGDENRRGYRAQVVPGIVRGLDELHRRYGSGRLSWSDLLQPAIERAADGVPVHPQLYAAWQPGQSHSVMEGDPSLALNFSDASRRLYLKPDGTVRRIGENFVQEDLAETLQTLADKGADDFYTGSIARRIADDFAESGGLLSAADLAEYQPHIDEPIYGTYRDHAIVTEPAPSMGPTIIEILNVLELFDVRALGWNSAEYLDVLSQILFTAFRDRDQHIGDPSTGNVEAVRLTSKAHAQIVRDLIASGQVRDEMSIAPAQSPDVEQHETTHIATIDQFGNACGITHSVGFGTGVVTPGLGFMHNCHMINFDPRPGRPNSIAPGKRPAGGGAPVMVHRDGRVVMSLGSPAGSLKASAMAQVLASIIDFGLSSQQAVTVDRIHVRTEPPQIIVDRRFDPRSSLALAAMGYSLEVSDYSARVAVVTSPAPNIFDAASDVRGDRGAITV